MIIWLAKLLLAHLLTDFLFQKASWIADRNKRHFRSSYLYLHTFLTAALAWLFIGWSYWVVALIILITHTIIDGWKSYQKDETVYFLIDQALHLLVIFACWWFTFYDWSDMKLNGRLLADDTNLWIKATAYVFVAWPSGFLVGQLTRQWRKNLPDSEGLANAGKWIGILERIIILTLVVYNQYESAGLLIAAKGIIRFSENNRTEQKTEYLVIGTLISIAIAMGTGMVVLRLMS